MLHLGEVNTLTIIRRTDNGFYLEDPEKNEVLLPNSFITGQMNIGDVIDVFLFKDSENRITASTSSPLVTLNDFAYLKAVQNADFGAFFNWGIEKDLLVPLSQQDKPIIPGNHYLVYMYLDEITDRLVGTTRVSSVLGKSDVELIINEKVTLIPYELNDIGYKCVVNGRFQGMLYSSEVFVPVEMGKPVTGYVKKVRDDNKVDLSLQKSGFEGTDQNVKILLEKLNENNGSLNLNDKTSPEEISRQLGMSKKSFKKAVGALYRQKLIVLTEKGIELT